MGESLHAFLKRKRKRPGVDWQKQRDEYLHAVGELHKKIRTWLKQSIEEGDVVVSTPDELVVEDDIPQYTAPGMILSIGDARVRFRPVGTRVVGALGRVDVLSGEHPPARLVLLDDGWTLTRRMRGGALSTVPLKRKVFEDLLRDMLTD
jgi:hypothetical protein